MDRLHAMRAFVTIVDSGSLTAAARTLETSQPSMVRTLAALERAVGVRLLNRTTRRMALTDEGREYYERCQAILSAIEQAHASLNARKDEPSGTLRITSSVPFGRSFVAPVVADFLVHHPRVRVDLLLLDRIVDLVEEGVDLAVRVAPLRDSSMVAVPVGQASRVIVASPSLIATSGHPRTAADLANRPCVSFTPLNSGHEWEVHHAGRRNRVRVNSVLVTNQIDAAIHACARGLGFGQFFDYHVHGELSDGRLVRVLMRSQSPPTPVSFVFPKARLVSHNVRAFLDYAVPRVRAQLDGFKA